jgi:hypothetical protein
MHVPLSHELSAVVLATPYAILRARILLVSGNARATCNLRQRLLPNRRLDTAPITWVSPLFRFQNACCMLSE